MIVDQLKAGWKQKISNNPFVLSGVKPVLIADGLGGFKKSGSTTPVSYTNPVRITRGFIDQESSEKREPKVNSEQWVIESDFETIIEVGVLFTWESYDFEIMFPIIPYKKFNGVYGYGANLKIVNERSIL